MKAILSQIKNTRLGGITGRLGTAKEKKLVDLKTQQ